METVFDHGITDEEIKKLHGDDFTRELLKELIKDSKHDSAMWSIAMLYALRHDFKTAEKYISKIQDEKFRWNCTFMLNAAKTPPGVFV